MCRPNALFFNIHPSFATAVHTEIPKCSNDPISSFWYYQILMFLFSKILSSCFRSFIFLLPSYFSMASVYITLTCWKSLNSQLSETRKEITRNSYLSLGGPFPHPHPDFMIFIWQLLNYNCDWTNGFMRMNFLRYLYFMLYTLIFFSM